MSMLGKSPISKITVTCEDGSERTWSGSGYYKVESNSEYLGPGNSNPKTTYSVNAHLVLEK